MKLSKIFFFFMLILLLVTGCKSGDNASDAQIKPVESFYNTIVSQQRDQIGTIACASWEKDAYREVDAFMGVKSEMKDFSCTVQNSTADAAEVVCKGKIAASYGNEITDFPIENRIHKVVKENGEWRLCGF
ncbi:MAG: hypothetical protein GX933_04305 [Chloroflexi bacterium]|nr:hypothetical protein [Chloroflexota bacterium]